MKEEWRPIQDFDGYEVSNKGQIRSFYERTYRGWKITDKPQRILSSRNSGHYPAVFIKDNDNNYSRHLVHTLVTQAFLGECPEELEVCHNNDNPEDNRITNLRYDTRESNINDAKNNDCYNTIEKRLSSELIAEIQERRATEYITVKQLAEQYKLTESAVFKICQGIERPRGQRPSHKNRGTSKYRGVYFNKRNGKWKAQISQPIPGKHARMKFIGTFESEIDAAKAYDREARKMYGEMALTNF